MCTLNTAQTNTVRNTLQTFVDRRKTFTGYDVVKKMRKAGYDRSQPAHEVTTYLRELFNGRDPQFSGYACIPVPGDNSPLLYFPVAQWVKSHCQKIQDAITK